LLALLFISFGREFYSPNPLVSEGGRQTGREGGKGEIDRERERERERENGALAGTTESGSEIFTVIEKNVCVCVYTEVKVDNKMR
jgi:hypothetical protein